MPDTERFLSSPNKPRQWKVCGDLIFVIVFTPIIVLLIANHTLMKPPTEKPKLVAKIRLTPISPQKSDPLIITEAYDYKKLPSCNEVQIPKTVNVTKEWRKMKECGFSVLLRFFGNPESVLPNFASLLHVCDNVEEMRGFKVKELQNSIRSHYVALPKCKDIENVFVNLGVEDDITAEQQLMETVQNMKMYGTSPTEVRDSTLYEHVFTGSIDKNYSEINMNISGEDTLVKVTALEKYLDTELQGRKFIDILWINARNGPFELHKYLSKDDLFDQLGLEVCQIGVEVKSDEHESFYALMLVVLNQWRHVFLRPTISDDGQFVRVVLFNAANERCYRKYFM